MGLLRLILALSVVAAHAGPFWPKALSGVGGDAAVEVFFVISGFYMALILSDAYKGRPTAFLVNRFLRVYPEFWLVSGMSLMFFVVFDNGWLSRFTGLPLIADGLLKVSNIAIFGSDLVMFLKVNGEQVGFGPYLESSPPLFSLLLIPQAWTLALELFFYFMAPWLVQRRTLSLLILVSVPLGLKFILAGLILQAPDPWTNRFIGFEISYFLVGILLFRYWTVRQSRQSVPRIEKNYLQPLFAVGLIVVLAPWLRTLGDNFGPFLGKYIVTAIIVASLTVLIPRLFSATKTSQLDKRLGEFSYPIYLSHILAIGLLGVLVTRISLSPAATFVSTLAIIFAVAWGVVLFARKIAPLRDRVRGLS